MAALPDQFMRYHFQKANVYRHVRMARVTVVDVEIVYLAERINEGFPDDANRRSDLSSI